MLKIRKSAERGLANHGWLKSLHTFSFADYYDPAHEELNSQDLVLVVSKTGRNGSISINQDADLYASRLAAGKTVHFEIHPGRHVWLQTIKGKLNINGTELQTGDAASTRDDRELKIVASADAEFLIFDLA